MERIRGGATIWARQTICSDIFYWKPNAWFKIWFYIVSRVNHTDTKLFKRGEGYFNWSENKRDLKKISRNTYQECIKWLKSQQQITTRKTTRGNIIFVVNYAKFQDFQNYKNITKKDSKSTASPQQVHSKSATICNNVKNDNNDNNEYAVAIAPACPSKISPNEPMLLRDFIEWTERSKQRHIRIIGMYADEKKIGYNTKCQWQGFIKRNLRAAMNLAPYEDKHLAEALKRLKNAEQDYLSKWTLETLSRYLEPNK